MSGIEDSREPSDRENVPSIGLARIDPRRGRVVVIAATFALVLIPLLWSLVPVEIARWYQAGALEAELDGDLARALGSMNKAASWCPNDPVLLTARAGLQLQLNDVDAALQDCQAAFRLDPLGTDALYYQRSLVYQRLGQHDKALADIEEIVKLAAEGTSTDGAPSRVAMFTSYDRALNLRAYSRALAGVNITEALNDIEDALRRVGDPPLPAYLDTRGYLKYLAGDLAGAEADMKAAIDPTEAEFEKLKAGPTSGDMAGGDPGLADPRYLQLRRRQLQEDLAVMYQHRGLIKEKQGRQPEAIADFARAKDFGYSPENGVW